MQPEIRALADLMYAEYKNSKPQELDVGEWHLPYITTGKSNLHEGLAYFVDGGKAGAIPLYNEISLEQAQKISASCCAQVSYRKLDDSLDKAIKIYDQLVTMTPVHASPFEHLATPIPAYMDWKHDPLGSMSDDLLWPKGVTHEDEEGNYWSGNLKGFIQYRQTIDGNACWDYQDE